MKENQLEKILKGFASKRRIKILFYLEKNPESSLKEISKSIKLKFRGVSQHIEKMKNAGLIAKRNDNVNVRHKLTGRGIKVLKFLKSFKE
ncbi:MAG: winged helix-turn-helix transcriptional regulator [Candidatus Pacebacteria bacterium]|nr:winged helix-turn-helix transcriptional regulator [Candidatus Paceibacterota bacterium]